MIIVCLVLMIFIISWQQLAEIMTIDPQGPFTAGDHGGCTYPIPGLILFSVQFESCPKGPFITFYAHCWQGPMVGVQALIWYQNLRAEVLHLTSLLNSAIVMIFTMIILIVVVRFLV